MLRPMSDRSPVLRRPLRIPSLLILLLGLAGASCGWTQKTATLPEGTTFNAVLETQLRSDRNQEGDSFVAYVPSAVHTAEGVEIPSGSKVIGEVAEVAHDRRATGMSLRFTALEFPDGHRTGIIARRVDLVSAPDTRDELQKIVAGGIIGGVLGGIAVAGRGVILGAGAGDMTGGVIAVATRDREIDLRPGQEMPVRILSPARVPLVARK